MHHRALVVYQPPLLIFVGTATRDWRFFAVEKLRLASDVERE